MRSDPRDAGVESDPAPRGRLIRVFESAPPGLAKSLAMAVGAISIGYILVYVFIALSRMSYPYELEWMEGGTVDHVRRILAGQALYVEPSLEFIPYSYSPLYYYLGALLSKVLGVGLFPLRLLSFLASIGCFAIVAAFVKRNHPSFVPALVAVGLYAATYRISGAWFDIARVDSLFLLFLLGTAYLLYTRTSVGLHVLAGVLMGLSFLTKQSALLVALALAAACLLARSGWLRFAYPLTFGAVAASTTLVGSYLTDGWYTYHLFRLPSQLVLVQEKLVTFWTVDLLARLPIPVALTGSYLGWLAYRRCWTELATLLALVLGTVGTAWSSRLAIGGYNNVLCPAYAAIAICAGLAVRDLLARPPEIFATRPIQKGAPIAMVRLSKSTGLFCLGAALLVAQFGTLTYDVRAQIPTRADVLAGDAFVRMLKATEGEVFVPYHGFLPALAGKKTHAHMWLMLDVLRSKDHRLKAKLQADLSQALRTKRFGGVALDAPWSALNDDLHANYLLKGRIFNDAAVFWTVTGHRTRPTSYYVPRR